MVRRTCGWSSPSPPNKRRLYGSSDSGVFLSVGEDKDEMISAEKDHCFEDEGNMDEDEVEEEDVEGDEDEDEDEEKDLRLADKGKEPITVEEEGEDWEDWTRLFQVGDGDVWETKSFSKYGKQNWACFYYYFDDDFYRLPRDYFKPGEDPRSRSRSFMLKMGHSLTYELLSNDFWKASYGAKIAIVFLNKENKMGKTFKFESLSKLSIGKRSHQPSGTIYFITFVATETDSGLEREFQASFLQPYTHRNVWCLRALREKPYVF
ncbi:hypothetical protein DM860_010045 [Cuscuta australis]|uniref:Uncharacterized protein n=1 Tax=Cuscuta australis TaxID=267555 RepID=A0A328DAA8_9ASTE|nr:hypothetical protein DM860_010045 [Cuscuta australis]